MYYKYPLAVLLNIITKLIRSPIESLGTSSQFIVQVDQDSKEPL